MYELLAAYAHPADEAQFMNAWGDHVALVKAMPGVRGLTWMRCEPVDPAGASPHFLTARVQFDSHDAAREALTGEQGRRAVEHLAVLAPQGAEIDLGDAHDEFARQEGAR